MNRKKQMIEEMAKEISRILFESCLLNMGGRCEDCECISKETKEYDCQSWLVAKKLLEKYQPKIPEGAVVLTKEEYKKLQALKDDYVKGYEAGVDEGWDNGWDNARKETAEKFAELVKMAFYYHFDELIPSIMADKIDEICKEISEGKV